VNTYTPDRWVIIHGMKNGEKVSRIVSGWWGGYLGSDEWRVSSEIATITEHDDRYEIDNHSGSQYTCYKVRWGLTGLSANALRYLKETQPDTQWEVDETYDYHIGPVDVEISNTNGE
jgi:hypothetical protein